MDFHGRELEPQHIRLIERAAARYSADPAVLALFVGGSIAHGYARPDSDVDVIVVVAGEPPALTFADHDLADYEGGYLDGKYVTREYLEDVAARGGEAARWALEHAIPVFTRDPELPELVARAALYPEAERERKLEVFVAHLVVDAWYATEAERHANSYLAAYASSRVALFASRVVLAHNRMLYPFHKWLRAELERAPEQPPRFLELLDAAVEERSAAAVGALAAATNDFAGIPMTIREACDIYAEVTELAWRDGRSSAGEL